MLGAPCINFEKIVALEDASGVVVDTKEVAPEEIHDLYTMLNSAEEDIHIEEVLHHVPAKVTDMMNKWLM